MCRLPWRASRLGLLVMRVACCTGWGDLVIGRCLHCCLSRRRCRQVVRRHVFVNVINTASTHIHVSCLTFGLCLNSLSLTAQQRGCSPPLTRPPPSPSRAYHLPLLARHVASCSGWAWRPHFDPFSSERGRDLLKHVPAPRRASTTGVYQPAQIKLGETPPDGEIDGKINVALATRTPLINMRIWLCWVTA